MRRPTPVCCSSLLGNTSISSCEGPRWIFAEFPCSSPLRWWSLRSSSPSSTRFTRGGPSLTWTKKSSLYHFYQLFFFDTLHLLPFFFYTYILPWIYARVSICWLSPLVNIVANCAFLMWGNLIFLISMVIFFPLFFFLSSPSSFLISFSSLLGLFFVNILRRICSLQTDQLGDNTSNRNHYFIFELV